MEQTQTNQSQMILIDYSQVALSTILTFQRELKGTESEVKNLIRHVTLSTIKSYKRKKLLSVAMVVNTGAKNTLSSTKPLVKRTVKRLTWTGN
jgi:hypothetical protein